MNLRRLLIALAVLFIASPAEARRHHYGACDGIHRCICGSTQARHFGLPRMVNGHNLWQAIEWTRAFVHTAAHSGAVMYQHGGGPTGHVSRIVSLTGTCSAIVVDETGQYERNTCSRGAVFVDPAMNVAEGRAAPSARRHTRYAQAVTTVSNDYMSRAGAGQ